MSNPDIEDMAPDSGAVIQKDVRKMAVYKDAVGNTHAYSAVCPHLGCLLQVRLVRILLAMRHAKKLLSTVAKS